jgi:hypothetical protein
MALAALATFSATARASGFVQIELVGGGSKTADLSAEQADITAATYANVAAPGGAPQTVTVTSGYSLPKLFKDLQIPTTFGSAEIIAPQGPPVVLTNTQATSSSAYQEGGGAPVVWGDGAGTHFLVPSTPSGAVNAGETFTSASITIVLHGGPSLSVGIFGSPVKAIVGKPVQFTSSVAGGTPLGYQWSFGDSTSGSQANPSHTYNALGTYDVYLRVTGSGDSVGASLVTHLVVGNPPPKTSSLPAGTSGTGLGTGGGTGGPGSGAGNGAGSQVTTAPARHVIPKRSHRRARQAPRPVGPLVSGVAISYISPPTGATGGGAGAARAAHLRANARGLQLGMWIWLGVLLALFGGALLEWNGWRRVRLLTPEAS